MTSTEPTRRADRYELGQVHGEGGLGRVWIAHDPAVGRVVALKELRAEQACRPGARERFLDEARITGQLEHPNIVAVYEVGESVDGALPYYTMRFVDGPTLADAIRAEFEQYGHGWPPSRRRMIRALCSVCHAISHAHERGVVHRDLKPDNVILGPHGELLLLDWGLAKRVSDPHDVAESAVGGLDPAVRETHAGSVIGTIAYMAPEQADGQPADPRTDVYGLGAILFEILTGRPPHAGADAGTVLARILDEDSPRARAVAPHAPAPLDAVCRRAMAKDPAARYPTADALLEDLERWLADEPVSELPDGIVSGVARWVRRHQSQAWVGALALFVVATVASIAAVLLGAAAERERALREKGLVAAAQLAARAVAIEIDLRWSVLEAAAAEPDLAAWLRTAGEVDPALQPWIETRFETQAERTLATSWIVMDRGGLQLARAPYGASVGANYAFRDYFHGTGRDLSETTDSVEPIRAAHRSIVFRSDVTTRMMVAFSVPILDPKRPDEVLGVLGMTVELGRFGVLDLGDDDSQITALVDTRQDWRGRRGLVLQHAQLARAQAVPIAEGRTLPSYYVPAGRVAQFRELSRGRLGGVEPSPRLLPLLETAYRDPVGGDYEGPWLAAFEPVVVRDRDTGWVVIAQEREAFE